MSIVFISGSIDEAIYLSRIGEYLRTKKVESSFVYTREYVHRAMKKTLGDRACFQPYRSEVCKKDVESCLLKYREHNLNLLSFSDPILHRKKPQEAIRIIVSFIRFWEEYISRRNVTAIAHYPTATALGRTAYIVGKKLGLKHLIFQTGPMVDRNTTICDLDENWIWSEFLEVYGDESWTVTQDMRQEVDQLVQRVLSTKNRALRIRPVTIRMLAVFLYRTLKYRKFDKIEVNELRKLLTSFFRKVPLLAFRYDRPAPDERYVFFPLHISWDAQIATRNPMFADQIALVEMLSRSLPWGCFLYVKEHPYNYGGEKLSLLRRIKQLPNVRLIHPEASSVDLIQNAAATVVINSTAGWESIILKKPVISFGRTFYAHFSQTCAVNHLGDLPDIMQRAVSNGGSEAAADYTKQWERFLWAVLSTAHDGVAVAYKNYMGLGAQKQQANVATLAESVYKKLQ